MGIRNGTAEQNLTIVPGQAWDSEMRETAQRVYDETGYGGVYVIGAIRVQGAGGVIHPVRGVIADDVLILQADHSRTSITQLADHEIFHARVRADPELREAARQKVIERYTPEEFRRMMDSYLVNLGGLYGNMSTEQAAEIITEEILADAYADINFFGYGADRFGSAVREAAQERAGAQQAQGTQKTRGPPERYSFEGYDEETGRGIYQSNFPKGTPKAAKAKAILHLIQDVWSKAPIELRVRNEDGSTRIIEAQFDPTYDENPRVRTDASKLMGGNRHGSAAEQRVTLDLADDYYQIAAESTFNYSKKETGKDSPTHEGVKQWHYFINDILFQEYGEKETAPYRVTINVKEKADGSFVYSFNAERQNEEPSTRQTLHADVTQTERNGLGNAQLSDNSIRSPTGKSNRNFLSEDEQNPGESEQNTPATEQNTEDSVQLFSADDSEFDEAMPEDRELLLNAAARDGAHPEVTAWGKKQARIETLERKAANLREAMENADEEERAEMQPILDKAEGQLQRAREDAAKMEGSPIIKRALDRERAAWREENPTEAAAAMRSLQQENKAMQEMVEYWKGQAKRTSDTDRSVMPEDTKEKHREDQASAGDYPLPSARCFWFIRVRKNCSAPRVLKELHPLRDDEVQGVWDKLHADAPGVHGLAVEIDDVFLLKVDGELRATQVPDILRIVVRLPGGVLADEAGECEEADPRHDIDIEDAVVGSRVQAGVEAAAVIAPVASRDQGVLAVCVIVAAAHVHGAVDALENVDRRRNDIAGRPADQGDAAVFVHLGADARVDADGADVGAVAAVAVDEVDGPLRPAKQGAEIAEEILFLPEHAAEVVARAGGVGTYRDVLEQRRAADTLVEGAVAPAGVDAQMIAVLRLFADLLGGVHRGRGHIDLVFVRAVPQRLLDRE